MSDRELSDIADAEPTPTSAADAELAAAALMARFPLSVARLNDTLAQQWLRIAADALRDYPAEVVREAIDGDGALSRSLKWLPPEAELRAGLDALNGQWLGDRGRARLALAVRHAPEHLRRSDLFQRRVSIGYGDRAYEMLNLAKSEAAR